MTDIPKAADGRTDDTIPQLLPGRGGDEAIQAHLLQQQALAQKPAPPQAPPAAAEGAESSESLIDVVIDVSTSLVVEGIAAAIGAILD